MKTLKGVAEISVANAEVVVLLGPSVRSRAASCPVVVALALLFTTLAVGCKDSTAAGSATAPPVPVTVAKAVTEDVPVRLQAIGSVQTVSSVSVRALVSGELKTVGFKQGDRVHTGQLLFTID